MALFVQYQSLYSYTSFNQSQLASMTPKELPVDLAVNGVSLSSMAEFWVVHLGGVPNSDNQSFYAVPCSLQYVSSTNSKFVPKTDYNSLLVSPWGTTVTGAPMKCVNLKTYSSNATTTIVPPNPATSDYINRVLASDITKDVVSGLLAIGATAWLGFLNVSAPGRVVGAGITLAKSMPSVMPRVMAVSTLPLIADTFFNIYNAFLNVPESNLKLENIPGTRTVVPQSLTPSSKDGNLFATSYAISKYYDLQANFLLASDTSTGPSTVARNSIANIFVDKLEIVLKNWEKLQYPDNDNDSPWFEGLAKDSLKALIAGLVQGAAARAITNRIQSDCTCIDKLIKAINDKDFGSGSSGGSSITSAELESIFSNHFKHGGKNVSSFLNDIDSNLSYINPDTQIEKSISQIINDKEIENSFVSLGGGDLFVD